MGLWPRLAQASPSADICEWAALRVSDETGVPADILAALTLTETGRRLDGVVRPWAWSVNAEGQGAWFDTPDEAISFAQQRVDLGRTNLDIGCFQINYRWHGDQFASVAQMFDPLENARYAARFVSELYLETGNWRSAAGAFHSRTAVNANRYLARFDTLRAMFDARGFDGMTNSPETYNQFAQVMSGATPTRRQRPRQMLLGAPLGSQLAGPGASLAVLGGPQSPIVAMRAQPIDLRPSQGGLLARQSAQLH